MNAFTPYVSEQLKAYVYLLIDPRDGEVFYVGKGNGSRVFAHALDALGDEESASDKLDRIREIHAAGQKVEHQLLRFGLTDRTAFEVEAAAIQLLGMDELTNKVEGHHVWRRGRMTTDVAISLIDAPLLVAGEAATASWARLVADLLLSFCAICSKCPMSREGDLGSRSLRAALWACGHHPRCGHCPLVRHSCHQAICKSHTERFPRPTMAVSPWRATQNLTLLTRPSLKS